MSERILDTLPTANTIAWDNPFPTWGPGKGKDKDRARHKSLEEGMDNMILRDGPVGRPGPDLEARPHTSQAHRRQDVPGSNMYSAPLPDQDRPSNFRLGSNQTVQSNRSNQIGYPHQQQYHDQQGSQGPLPRMRDQATSRNRPVPKRSNTLPTQDDGWQDSRGVGDGDGYQSQQSQQRLEPQQPPLLRTISDDSRGSTKGAYGLPSGPRLGQRRPSEPQRDSLEMPNFDAIPRSLEDKPHDHMEPLTSPPSSVKTAYNMPSYQAFSLPAEAERPSLNKMKSQPNVKQYVPNQRQQDVSNFSFGFSGTESQSRSHSQQAPQNFNANGGFPPRSQSRAADNANNYPPQRIQSPETYFRQQDQYGQSKSFTNANRPPLQPLVQRSVSDNQAVPPKDTRQGNNHNEQHDYGYNQQYGQTSNQQQYYDQDQSADQFQPFYDGHSQQSRQAGTPTGKPAPLQMQNVRSESRNAIRPDRQMTPASPTNPDALPAHPVPVRPGLMPQSGAPQPSTRPPPVRQYGNGPTQQQQPMSAGAMAPRASLDRQDAPVTAYDLNLLQQKVKGSPQDYKTGLLLAKKLVEAASVLSKEGGRADAKTAQKNREKYIFDAHKVLKRLINVGYPDAMFYLADCHGNGMLGLERDSKEAFNLYQSAAKSGHGPSAYRVAVCCELGAEEGGGTRRDPMKAIQWYRRAASLGDTPAMYKLGMILLKGLLGQQKNPREALSWLKRAAEKANRENPHALHELGLLYESAQPNDAIIRDENYARELFHQAGDLEYKYSQFRLGTAYEHGQISCPVDPKQSIMWYTRAAAQGEHQAELALSGWYLTGSADMLPQSDTEAYLWARKSASSGYAKAEYAMGYFTEMGIGAPANLEEAKRWYWRAACKYLELVTFFAC